ncbi:MAG: PrsW family glutamic-type intramembrane protease [bacterium]
MSDLVRIAVSLLPVFAFLGGLVLMDSFKLVRARALVEAIVAGCAVAVACFFINRWLLGLFPPGSPAYSRYVAPAIEETLKAAFVAHLVLRRRVGFLVDAAVLGFAVGAGFAFVENIHYLRALEGSSPLVWVLRGLGTAVMHGGTTAAFAVLAQGLAERRPARSGASAASRALGLAAVFLPGLAVAYAVHSLFNHFFLPPVANTVAQLAALPAILAVIFNRSERALRDWLEVGLDTDVRLLEDIATGSISATRPGQYLESLRSRFPGEVVADMLCLLRTHLELAARAKGILLMRQAGFQVEVDPGIDERLAELRFLQKSIGATGRLALAPILHSTGRDIWQLRVVGKG